MNGFGVFRDRYGFENENGNDAERYKKERKFEP